MTIVYRIRDKKLQCDINRDAAKISALSSEKLINMNIFRAKKYTLQSKSNNKISQTYVFSSKNSFKVSKPFQ